MKFQQTHLILTAVSVPVAIVVCWLVYKRTCNRKDSNKKDELFKEQLGSANDVGSNKELDSCNDTKSLTTQNKFGNTHSETLMASEEVDSISNPTPTTKFHDFKNSSKENLDVSSTNLQYSVCNGDSSELSAVESSNLENNTVEMFQQEELTSSDATETEIHVKLTVADASACLPNPCDTLKLSQSGMKESISLNDCSQIEAHPAEIASTECDGSQQASENEQKPTIEDQLNESIDENSASISHIIETVYVNGDSNFPASNTKKTIDDEVEMSDNVSIAVTAIENVSTNDSNTNNNNSTDSPCVNGQNDSPTRSSPCSEKSSQYCASYGNNKIKTPLTSDNEHNGWDESNSSKTDSDELQQDEKEDKNWGRKRPSSLHRFDYRRNGDSAIQVHVEFPSDKVGLLIGKQGRNIKQLKQDSGADVFVHAAKNRDDIQVLQICGTQSEIESCVSRIKRRFNDVTLTPFDPANICTPPSSSSGASPNPNSPPPLAFSMPNISQLRLPEGHTVDVLVSAIAAVDCLFLQQYTHPSYQALENLERAMAHCYAEPSTPSLPKPIQAGLICAAPQQGMWYRAQVIQCNEESEEILIKFMDYGGYATIPENSIKQIRADFVTLPFQAIECYLDNIAPPEDNRFCEEAVSKIAELLKDGRYQARVTGYRSDGNAKVHLYKCQNNEVALINQAVVTKGLATWVEPAPYH